MPRSPSPNRRGDRERRQRDDDASDDSRRHRKRTRDRSRSRSSRERSRDRHKKHKHSKRDRSSSRHRHRSRSRSRSRDRHERRDAPPPKQAAAALPSGHVVAASAPPKTDDIADRAARIFGYTAENNPFGDPNLTQAFVWKKREEKAGSNGAGSGPGVGAGGSAGGAGDIERRREELLDEVERAKQRRAKREAEREEMDRLRAEENRLKEAANYREWEARDDEFHLHQARQKATIRLREGRGTPVDLLVFNFLLHDTGEAMSGHGGDVRALLRDRFLRTAVSTADPVDVLQSLDKAQLETLLADVKNLRELEAAAASAVSVGVGGRPSNPPLYGSSGAGASGSSSEPIRMRVGGTGTTPPMTTLPDVWSLIETVAESELRRMTAREAGLAAGRSMAALKSVEDEVDAMFEGKTEADLDDMEGEVNELLNQGAGAGSSAAVGASGGSSGAGAVSVGLARGAAVDTDYWEGVLSHLRVARARAVLRRKHEQQLLTRLAQVQRLAGMWASGEGGERARSRAGPGGAGYGSAGAGSSSAAAADADSSSKAVSAGDAAGAEERRRLIESRIAELQQADSLLDNGPAISGASAGGGRGGRDEASREGDDMARMGFVDDRGRPLPSGDGEADLAAEAEVQLAPMPDGDGIRLPQNLSASEAALLADKYKPRKPRYFNRVKTGYDWNSYNKTHYDKDNPPPKTVHGYKFTLFYPDLLERSHTPKFSISPADSPDYCIIRFKAGPPYEDVAFKIVNREWEYSRKHGFKCVFDRGVLQLHFNFKRYRYRK